MSSTKGFFLHFFLGLLSLFLHINISLTYSMKNCSTYYEENFPDELSLNCMLRKLQAIPDDIPKSVVSIWFSENWLQTIGRNFSGMTKLKFLDLSYNHITCVEDGSFIDSVALEHLYLSRNKLTNLTCDLFEGLSNLTLLDLSDNQIQYIHFSALRFLTRLRILKLNSNRFQQVADFLPALQLPQIHTLFIGDNEFSTFQTKDMPLNLSSTLRVLDVNENKLKTFSITTPIFPNLDSLEFSQIRQKTKPKWVVPDKTLLSNITQLYILQPAFSFKSIQKVIQDLSSLMHLRLNYVTVWFRKGLLTTICKNPKLRILDLSYNHFNNFTVQLSLCSKLRELDLGSAYITKLPKGSIASMRKLQSLNLINNFLTKIPDDIQSLSSLEILEISNNFISEFTCGDFVNTTNLTELYADWNRIAFLNECAFENLPNLKVLNLARNLLWALDGTFRTALQNMEELDISQNFIDFVEGGDFRGLHSLKHLNVKSNHVSRVKRRAFEGLTNMETLVVSLSPEYEPNFKGLHQLESLTIYLTISNTLDSSVLKDFLVLKSLKNFAVICDDLHPGFPLDVPYLLFQSMPNLESFTAENVYVQAPDSDTFQYNFQLKSLTITQTDLSDLDPALFQTLQYLEILNFTQCNLKSLDFLMLADFTALKFLKLSDNQIGVISEVVFHFLPSLTYLDLNNNPFICDCSNANFVQWVKDNNQTFVVDAYQYECAFPVAEQGRMLLDFDVQSCWVDGGFLYFIFSTCLVLVTLLTSFFYNFLRWQLVYAVYLCQAFLYDRRKKNEREPAQFDAFVSYNVYDEEWVCQEMLPVLEGEQGWRLCLHHRDFQLGKPIMENITDAIYGSRKTICVISRHYLQSEWCSREIQMASFRLFDENKDVLILIFLEEIPSAQLSPYHRMRKIIKKRTYLSWPQAAQNPGVFWMNVERALKRRDEYDEQTNILTGQREC